MNSRRVLSEPRSDAPHGQAGSGPRHVSDTGVHARPRVLIAEDDDDTRAMYAWAMRAAGWVVDAETNGLDALFFATDFKPDVIVMDLGLPRVDGFEAIRRLRRNAETRDIPVVALTGGDPSRTEALARESGCTDFVRKPCLPETLRMLLEDLVAARER